MIDYCILCARDVQILATTGWFPWTRGVLVYFAAREKPIKVRGMDISELRDKISQAALREELEELQLQRAVLGGTVELVNTDEEDQDDYGIN